MLQIYRDRFAAGHGSCPLVGDPDTVADGLAEFARAGFDGIALSFLNYADELGYFAAEVMPRLRPGVCCPSTLQRRLRLHEHDHYLAAPVRLPADRQRGHRRPARHGRTVRRGSRPPGPCAGRPAGRSGQRPRCGRGQPGVGAVRGGGVIVDTPPTAGHFAMCAPIAPMGVEYRATRNRDTAYGSLVLSHDEPMRMTPHPMLGCLVIATSTGRLADHLAGYLGRDYTTPLRFHSVDGLAIAPAAIVERTWRHCATSSTMRPPRAGFIRWRRAPWRSRCSPPSCSACRIRPPRVSRSRGTVTAPSCRDHPRVGGGTPPPSDRRHRHRGGGEHQRAAASIDLPGPVGSDPNAAPARHEARSRARGTHRGTARAGRGHGRSQSRLLPAHEPFRRPLQAALRRDPNTDAETRRLDQPFNVRPDAVACTSSDTGECPVGGG